MRKAIKYLTLSDLHLGHKRNKTIDIVKNLMQYFQENIKVFSTLDLIVLNGDVYDRLLPQGSQDSILAFDWLCWLARYCQTHTIKLRIVEGTPSHDVKQIQMFTTAIVGLDINVDIDFKYITDVEIEYLHEFDLNILYIPDEISKKASDTYEIVKELLSSLHLTQVDIGFVHGQFHFQLPMVLLESSHNESDYLSIVRHFIHVGHIHKPMYYSRILGNGSFDRLAQGEEEAKGGIFVYLTPNAEDKFIFIENKRAKSFISINIDTHDLIEAKAIVGGRVKKLLDDSYISLVMEKDNPVRNGFHVLKDTFSRHNLSIAKKKSSDEDVEVMVLSKEQPKEINITPSNIKSLWVSELSLNKSEHIIFEKEVLELMF